MRRHLSCVSLTPPAHSDTSLISALFVCFINTTFTFRGNSFLLASNGITLLIDNKIYFHRSNMYISLGRSLLCSADLVGNPVLLLRDFTHQHQRCSY